MDSFLKIINCCKKEEVIKNQTNCEVNVPLDNDKIKNNNYQNISYSPDKSDFRLLESLYIKSTVNNTMTLNENNISNHNSNTVEYNSNNNSNSISNINNTNTNPIYINKVDTFAIENQRENISPRNNNINNTHILSNNHTAISKIINNNSNNYAEMKKNYSSSNISKVNKNIKDISSNKGTILTLNDLDLDAGGKADQVHQDGFSSLSGPG